MVFDLVDYFLGMLKMVLYAICYLGRLSFHPYGKYSLKTVIRIYHHSKVCFGKNVTVRQGGIFRAYDGSVLNVGDNVGFNSYCLVTSMCGIEIGEDTIIGQGVKIFDHDHNYKEEGKRRETGYNKAPVKIGKNVWIGSDVIILKGTTIGDNAVIGAGCVIKGEVPAGVLIHRTDVYQSRKIR